MCEPNTVRHSWFGSLILPTAAGSMYGPSIQNCLTVGWVKQKTMLQFTLPGYLHVLKSGHSHRPLSCPPSGLWKTLIQLVRRTGIDWGPKASTTHLSSAWRLLEHEGSKEGNNYLRSSSLFYQVHVIFFMEKDGLVNHSIEASKSFPPFTYLDLETNY